MQHFVGVAGNFGKESWEVEIMQHAVSLLLRSSQALCCRNSTTKKLRRDPCGACIIAGADFRTRTGDPILTMDVLYLLS